MRAHETRLPNIIYISYRRAGDLRKAFQLFYHQVRAFELDDQR